MKIITKKLVLKGGKKIQGTNEQEVIENFGIFLRGLEKQGPIGHIVLESDGYIGGEFDPAHQNMGYGSIVIDAVADLAEGMGLDPQLIINAGNKDAIKDASEAGFVKDHPHCVPCEYVYKRPKEDTAGAARV